MIVNFETFTDADLVQSFLYQSAAGGTLSLGANSLRLQARIDPSDPTVWMDCSTLNGLIVVTNAELGAFTLTLPLSILLNMPPGVYFHSLIMTNPVTTLRAELWRGTIVHAAGATRWPLGTM